MTAAAYDKFKCQLCDNEKYKVVLSKVKDWEYGTPGEFDYYQCQHCDQIQLYPFPTIEDLGTAYPENYGAYTNSVVSNSLISNLLYGIKQKILEMKLKPYIKPGSRVLEVGSGNGEFLEKLLPLGVTQLEGVDFSAIAVDLSSKKGIKTFHGLFLDFPAEPASFDAIFMFNYIEHVLDPIEELTKAKKLLKPGGILAGEVPNFAGLDRVVFGKYWGSTHSPRHTYHYDTRTFRARLHTAGFEKIKLYQDLSPGCVTISIQNWLQRNVKDLKNNPNVINGRMKYFLPVIIATLPVNLVFKLLGRSSIMTFVAEA